MVRVKGLVGKVPDVVARKSGMSSPQNPGQRQKTLHPRPSNEIHGTKERGALHCAWRRQEL